MFAKVLATLVVTVVGVWWWLPFGQGGTQGDALVKAEVPGAGSLFKFEPRSDEEMVDHVFRVTNRESRTWRLTGLRSSCGCLAGGTLPDQVGPGESFEVPVRMYAPSSLLSGEVVEQSVYVDLEDGRKITLQLRGQFIRPVPRFIELPTAMSREVPLVVEVEMHPASSGRVRVHRVDSPLPTQLVAVHHGGAWPVDGRETLRARVQLDVSSVSGRLDVPVTFHLEGSSDASLTTRVVGWVSRAVEADASRVSLGPMAPGERAEQTVTLRSGGGADFTVAEVRVLPVDQSGRVEVRLTPDGNQPSSQARVTFTGVGEHFKAARRLRCEVLAEAQGQTIVVPLEIILLSSGVARDR